MTSANPKAPWRPLSFTELRQTFSGVDGWCVCGGHALRLFVGHQYREHGDLDVSIRRAKVGPCFEALLSAGLKIYAADPPGNLRPVTEPDAAKDYWIESDVGRWVLQLVIDEHTASDWVYRRDTRVHLPLGRAELEIDDLKVRAPEIQLLYKSIAPARPVDRLDFDVVEPRLSLSQSEWLAGALRLTYPDHPWLERLA